MAGDLDSTSVFLVGMMGRWEDIVCQIYACRKAGHVESLSSQHPPTCSAYFLQRQDDRWKDHRPESGLRVRGHVRAPQNLLSA